MPVTITIRGVPEETRDKLKQLAVNQGLSLQKFLQGELCRIVSHPSSAEWVREVSEWKQRHGVDVPVSAILEAKDADRT